MNPSQWDWLPSLAIDGILFLAYAGASAAALALLKLGLAEFQPSQWAESLASRSGCLLAIGTICYTASFGIWLVLLARLPASIAYPIAIGLALVAVAAVDAYWFDRTLSASQLGALALILSGIAVLFCTAGAGSDNHGS